MATFDNEARDLDAPIGGSPEDSGVFIKRTRARVLVIDDELLILRSVTRTLSAHEVVGTTDARAALDMLSDGERFDLVLCDLMMPDVDGIEVYKSVRAKHPELAHRFVFMTGGVFSQEGRTFLASCGAQHLEKPFNAEAIRRYVSDALAAR